jgi:serine/threonine protein kinase
MGEVYRATDTKLGRDVALKILPDSFVHDPERLARFRREAQVLASLNHPHIGAIYGIDEANGIQFLVLELIDGETLADRIGKGALPLDEALPIARQIAEALEAAHERGIIHRDLKPANVALTRDGNVKVLDFGLAKALDPAEASSATMSPTLTIHATQAGMLLGTAAYMAPEQARGKAVDARADIWAFGVVLFEMLAGRRPFDGGEISDTLASILKSEPAWHLLPSDTPAPVLRLLRRSLQKDRRQRLQHSGDARLDIEDALRPAPADSGDVPVGTSRRMRLVWMPAAVAAAALIGAAGGWRAAKAPDAPEMRVEITTPGTNRSASFALSPDGRSIVFTADGPRGSQLWIRPLDATSARPLAGSEGGLHPFWSPDSRSVGFFASSRLKRLDLEGGPAQTLAVVITPAGGTWNRDGTILFVPNDNGGVFRVSAMGGETSQVTPRRAPGLATRLPQFLPDGRHFLFFVARGEPPGVYTGEIGSDAVRRILVADAPALYGSGYLWFVREGSLFAQMFDPSTQELSGPVARVSDSIAFGLIGPPVSASAAGPIAYRTGTSQSVRQLIWFDRSGKQLGVAGEEGRLLSNPSLSPDGRRVVVQRTVEQNIDVWSLDLERNIFDRVTLDPAIDSMPLWSPDGRRILFNSLRSGNTQLLIKQVDGARPDEVMGLPSGGGVKIPCDWSSDGRFVLYKQFDEITGTTDLWVVPMDGPGPASPFPVVRTAYDERDGQFSPDGGWIAFESDESGAPEIYLQPFPGPGAKLRISTGGGSQVRWRRDGKEIFYLATDNSFMSVAIDIAAGRSDVGTPVPLFKTRVAPIQAISRQQYVVAPDGQRFLISTSADTPTPPITLILNWKPTAQR